MALIKVFAGGVLLLLSVYCHAKSVKDNTKNEHVLDRDQLMSLDAQQTLLDEIGVGRLDKIREAVPLYREDLPNDYIAYWQVEYDNQYITVSSGSGTGDYDILVNGLVPSPTSLLRERASTRRRKCFRFYVLTSGGEMMCTDEDGKIVATTLPEKLILRRFQNETDEPIDVDMIHNYIKSKSEEQALEWKTHTRRVRKQQMDEDEDEDERSLIRERLSQMSGNSTSDSLIHRFATDGEGTFRANFIVPGSPLSVVVDKLHVLKEIRIRYIPTGPEAYKVIPDLAVHRKLCQVVKTCKTANENYALMSNDAIELDAGLATLELDKSTKKVFKGEEFVFALDIVRISGSITSRYFAVKYRPSRQKRSSYSSWSYWSIANEDLFPEYDQFEMDDCAVGCGPVAWSMVFGYYDRRSHYNSAFTGSENLYGSGSDGTTGSSSEVAPKYNDDRMRAYIKEQNEILKTFCLFGQGATFYYNMNKVEDFFRARETSWWPRLQEKAHWLSWLGIYSDSVESWTKYKLQDGWPVIVGWRDGSYLAWHYPVATRVRTRIRTYESCCWWVCKTKTSTEDMMYLHMGWGGYGNGWKNLQAFYGITAVY
ncbi:hypothetical protein LSH36_202g12059 [Paralvinella palmiformis]|uniref:Uncharacterized protein n=1 Tax=Paralvinella palmiformis TaxID=53620 RepID=A0AAD9JQ85_9ANNE|nr:hypothetical protein LSH36_202g12059 [Paralvinella palmiformis]